MTSKTRFPVAFVALFLVMIPLVRSAAAPDAEPRLGEFSISKHISGPEVDLKKAGAKLTVLYFWGARCAPCLATLPKLVKLDKTYRDKGLVIVGIHAATGDVEDIRKVCRKHKVGFAVYKDYKTPKTHRSSVLPYVLMFDAQGKLVFHGHFSLITKEIEQRFGGKAGTDGKPVAGKKKKAKPGGKATATGKTINLADKAAGEFVLAADKLVPDGQGVLAKFDLVLPAFKRAVYYQGGWWPAGGNRVYSHLLTPSGGGKIDIREVNEKIGPEGGLFAIFEKTDGRYLALLPLAGDHAYAWLDSEGGKLVKRADRQPPTEEFNHLGGTLRLKLGHHGIARVSGPLPVCVWATGSNPYEAASKVWKRAAGMDQVRGALKLREGKEFPEPFRYLGWCSWDCLGMAVTAESMDSALKGLSASDVPVRWALMDDGHYDKKTLLNNEKFPESYAPMMTHRADDSLKWLGIWYAMFGNFGGTHQNPGWDEVGEHYKVVGTRMMPKENLESGRAFFRHIFREGTQHGFDVLKIDFQTYNINFFRGNKPDQRKVFPNPYAASVVAQQAFHEVLSEDYKALINCNWHNPANIFKSFDSVVGRCSEDNRGGEQDAISHTFHAFASTPWLGQIAWGDHDMFHSGDRSRKAAEFNAVAKAMSGGPVYLSELAEKIRPELVNPLVYQDGELLRPLAPATPLAEDLFHQLYEERLMAAVVPLANRCALFAVYGMNRRGPTARKTYSRTLTASDYSEASGMIQPYPGSWAVPEDGLVVYDWYAGTARELGDGFGISLMGFDFRALQMSPIVDGVAVIGRTDKYLAAAGVKEIRRAGAELTIDLAESGPLGIWCRKGEPRAEGVEFENRGGGLFVANMPTGVGGATVKINIVE